jgi:hypothetical protein
MTTTTKPYPDIPLPDGAKCDDTWHDSEPQRYRIVRVSTAASRAATSPLGNH